MIAASSSTAWPKFHIELIMFIVFPIELNFFDKAPLVDVVALPGFLLVKNGEHIQTCVPMV